MLIGILAGVIVVVTGRRAARPRQPRPPSDRMTLAPPPSATRAGFSTIAHGTRRILGPIDDARLERSSSACPLERGDHVLEIGCGKAELLVRLLARWPGATAEGFDRNPWFLADGRAAAEAAGGDVGTRLSLIETDAPAMFLADRSVAMTIALGRDRRVRRQPGGDRGRAGGGHAPGGLVVFGDGLWIREPSAAGLRAFGMARDEMVDGVDGFAALGTRGRPARSRASRSSTRPSGTPTRPPTPTTIAVWAAAHPDDPEHDEFVARSAMMAESYRDWRRDAFGFAIGRFRIPAETAEPPVARGGLGQAAMTQTMMSSSRARTSGRTTPAASSSRSASSR